MWTMRLDSVSRKMVERLYPFLREVKRQVYKCGGGENLLPHLDDAGEFFHKKVSSSVLDSTPWEYSYDWCGGAERQYNKFWVVKEDSVISLQSSDSWSNGSGRRGESSVEPIYAQLYKMGIKDKDLFYLVSVEYHSPDANGNGEHLKKITLYKPSGFDEIQEVLIKKLKEVYKELLKDLQ